MPLRVQLLGLGFGGEGLGFGTRKVDVRLPGKGNSKSHGARPVLLIIKMMKWIRTSRLSITNSLSVGFGGEGGGMGDWGMGCGD